jgi:hypothetical protein
MDDFPVGYEGWIRGLLGRFERRIMDGNIETAAKKFGVYLIVATVVFIIGLNMTLTANTKRLGRNIERAGTNARSGVVSFPPSLKLHLFPQGIFQVDLSPNGKELHVAPIKVEVEAKTEE